MVKGQALNIGLNSVDPNHYVGWSGELFGCEADASDMAMIAKSGGFGVTTLLTRDATRDRVSQKILDAAKILEPGDIFLITYSGHGGQLPDRNYDEVDALDETWCLYDGELVDDELYTLLGNFAQGVRILAFSDSCHSGTVVRARAAITTYQVDATRSNVDDEGTKYRFIPIDAGQRTYFEHRAFYDPILSNPSLAGAESRVKGSVILISGCQDNQYSADGPYNGLFTSMLLSVWKNGLFKGDYKEFHKEIVTRMPPSQTPNFYLVGSLDGAYVKQRPFTI